MTDAGRRAAGALASPQQRKAEDSNESREEEQMVMSGVAVGTQKHVGWACMDWCLGIHPLGGIPIGVSE